MLCVLDGGRNEIDRHDLVSEISESRRGLTSPATKFEDAAGFPWRELLNLLSPRTMPRFHTSVIDTGPLALRLVEPAYPIHVAASAASIGLDVVTRQLRATSPDP